MVGLSIEITSSFHPSARMLVVTSGYFLWAKREQRHRMGLVMRNTELVPILNSLKKNEITLLRRLDF